MKKVFLKISVALVCAGLVFSSCSKKDDDNVTPTADQQQTVGSDDTRTQNESDATGSEAEAAIADNSSTQRTSAASVVQGATIDATNASSQKKLVINYDGTTNVGGRKRSGKINVQLTSGTSWSDANSVITLTYVNYKATRVSDGKSITLNGSTTIKNTSGGSMSDMTLLDTRVRVVRSNGLSVTYDNGAQSMISIAKKRTIGYPSIGVYTVTVVGDTIVGSHGDSNHHLAVWGTTRVGTQFYTTIADNNPIVWSTASCTTAPASGMITITGIARQLDITYGVDANGDPVNSASCAYGIKLGWLTITGQSKSAILIY